MNARRKIVVLAVAIAPLLVIGAACSFPDVAFAPAGGADGGGSDSPNGREGSVDAGEGGKVVGANEDVDPDGGSQEAATRPEGGPMIDAAGCTCDCDQDGFQPATGACDGGPGPRPDCDDFDDFVKPDAGFVAVKWTSGHAPSGDWNCDGLTTKQYEYNQPCTDPNNCLNKSGFGVDPECGETATFNICHYTPGALGTGIGAMCDVGSTMQVTQGCK